jgi:hypothetical protein
VEEITLTAVGESATFRAVELAQATLSVNGQSAVQDVAVFTQNLVKPMEAVYSYTKEISIDMELGAKVYLKTTFVPSNDDLRRLLYDQLNEATQRKASVRENLRISGGAKSKGKKSVSFGGGRLESSKSKPKAEPSKIFLWFQTAIAVVPRVKNYIIFAAFVIASNYRGHLLALPEPV